MAKSSAVFISYLLCTVFLRPIGVCRADSGATSDRVTSQQLFERGKSLLLQESFAEACSLLEESHRLSPGVGVLLHLGVCFEKMGKTASAWAAFQEAADRAKIEKDFEREDLATSRAAELRANLPYLRLRLHRAGSPRSLEITEVANGTRILLDGHPLSKVTLGVDLPTDPGEHTILVRTPDMVEVERHFTLSEGMRAELDLQLVPVAGTDLMKAGTTFARPKPVTRETDTSGKSVAQGSRPGSRALLWSSVGVGAAGFMVGVASGLVAYTKMRDARALCEGYSQRNCPPDSTRLQSQAEGPANVATASIAIGAAALVFAGGYWLSTRSGHLGVAGTVSSRNTLIELHTCW
jgi:hypothetical protein